MIQSSWCTLDSGEYASDELYAGFVDRIPLEADVRLLA